jgi:hypothetical protein
VVTAVQIKLLAIDFAPNLTNDSEAYEMLV